MKAFLTTATLLAMFIHTSHAFAAPNPEAAQPNPTLPLVRVMMHKLENGEKKSSKSIAAQDGGSAETFTVTNNTFERNFFNPEILDNGQVLVRLHQCTGQVTSEQKNNPSSIDCRPELMTRMNFEASFKKPTIVETTGPNGEKQEYYIFVEKLSNSAEATTL